MMRKIFFYLLMLTGVNVSMAQTTYYWVVGNKTNADLNGANWNIDKTANTGQVRVAATNDILVFDNVTVKFGLATATFEIGELRLINNADLTFNKGSSNTANLKLNGVNGKALSVVNSILRLTAGAETVNSIINVSIPNPGVVGEIDNGKVYLNDNGGGSSGKVRFATHFNGGTLFFKNKSECYLACSSSFYPFGDSNGTANSEAGKSSDGSVIFESGTSLIYEKGGSPFGNTTTGHILDLKSGSNFILKGNNVSRMFSNKTFGNVVVESGATVDLGNPKENFTSIDSLTVEEGGKFLIRRGGAAPFKGSIIVNGQFGLTEVLESELDGRSSSINFIGDGRLQTIGGSGTFGDIGVFQVAEVANVKLGTNLNLTGTNPSNSTGNTMLISGTLDLGTYEISSNGVAAGKGAKFTTASGATLISSHSDGINGNIKTTGTKTFAASTNYIFKSAMVTPFPIENTNSLGNVTFELPSNSNVIVNENINIEGKLILQNTKLIIPEGISMNVASTTFDDGIYSDNSYIVTQANTSSGAVGKLYIQGDFTTQKLFPIGTADYYLPVSVISSEATSFNINVFNGITKNAEPNGESLANKDNVVDALWNINQEEPKEFKVTFNWPNVLSGIALTSNSIGIAQFNINDADYGVYSSTSYNANQVTGTFNSNGVFSVGSTTSTTPVELVAFNVRKQGDVVNLNWLTLSEKDNSHFTIEHSVDGNNFSLIGKKEGAGYSSTQLYYSFIDYNPKTGYNYYRLVQHDKSGNLKIFDPQVVNIDGIVKSKKFEVFSSQDSRNVLLQIASSTNGTAVVSLYNIEGKKVLTEQLTLTSGNNTYAINSGNLIDGFYSVNCQVDNAIYRGKTVIK